jgi:two-component system OmpR family sensor kinase/two-component system sensor histidine kinase BaeS
MHTNTVRAIRNRLYLLLLRAFGIVVLIIFIVMTTTTALVLLNPSQSNPLFRLPIAGRLETFYLSRGNWGGVGVVFNNPKDFETRMWREGILLDQNGFIIVDRGVEMPGGLLYIPGDREQVVPIVINGAIVGKFVLSENAMPPQRRYAFDFLQPVMMVSVFLAILTVVIGLLLTRRMVLPLAEVTAAAKEVAGGDLSTRVRVEGPDDLRILSDSFNQMADALERNDRDRRDMLADIAHELRTPLTVLRGRLEGIQDGVYPADEAHIVPALEEAYLLERLVDDLRLLTLAETRQLPFEKKELDLNDLARHVISLFQAQAEENKIELWVEDGTEIRRALLDPQRTEQVIGNLISNALRYVPEGGRVWIEVRSEGELVSVSVNDNGPGVPEEELPHIFSRFWRGDKSRTRASGGAGLGLAIARQLVEAQGGRIAASNLPGGGLQVRCEFPAA